MLAWGRGGRVVEVGLEAGGKAAEDAETGLGAAGQDTLADDGHQGRVLVRWEVTEELLELGDEEDLGDEGQELGEGGLEGHEGFEGVASAGVDGGDCRLEVEGKVCGVGNELAGQVGKLARG